MLVVLVSLLTPMLLQRVIDLEPGDLEAAYREASGMKDRVVFMDIIVDPSENVYPMIEAGKGHHEMHLSPHLSSDRELA